MTRAFASLPGWVVCATFVALGIPQTPPTAPPPAAQTPPVTTQQPVFRSSVEIVHMDISVLDKVRRPVRGLKETDFTVLEDGKPQPVANFAEVYVPDTAEPPAKWMKVISPNDLRDSRLFVIVLDDALIPADPRMTNNAKDIVRKIVDKLGPTDLAAIVLTGDNRNTQDFTNDHGRLLAVLDKFSPGLANYSFGTELDGGGNTPNMDVLFYENAVNTLRNVADFLVAVPQRRKSLIWVSPGVPVDPEANAPQLIQGPSGGQPGNSMADREAMMRLFGELPEIFRRAQRANVSIYPIDPGGPGGMEQYIMARVQKRRDAMEFAHKQANLLADFAMMMAENTGGHAVLNTNEYETGITQVFRENSSYYLLGFQPTNTKTDGKLRRVEVKVNRPDMEVRARNGYYAPEPIKVTDAAKAASASPLATAMASLLPTSDMPMQVTVAPFLRVRSAEPKPKDGKKPKDDEKQTATVAITLGAKQNARAESATAKIVEDVELLASAFTPEGTSRGSSRQTAHLSVRQGATGLFGYEVLTRLNLAPGRYELRLAMYSGSIEKLGSVFADVVVPDFVGAPLSLSGVLVNKVPSITSGPKGALADLASVAPTSDRDFRTVDQLTMFMRVYQGGKAKVAPVTMTTKILGIGDKVLMEKSDTLDASKFNLEGRGADFSTPVDVKGLPPGAYVINFTATLGKDTVSRDVRFTVR